MERGMRRFLYYIASCGAFIALACGTPSDDEPSGTPSPVPTPQDFAAIRDVELASLPETETLLQRLGSGRVAEEEAFYADLTGDMRDDAVVPITSDGTLGNIAYVVYTLKAGRPSLILTRTMDRTTASGLVMDLDDFGALRETVGIYAAEDPLCCPSQLRLTTFHWDGTSLQVAGEQKLDQPNKAKQ
jgi:hypothetical protein